VYKADQVTPESEVLQDSRELEVLPGIPDLLVLMVNQDSRDPLDLLERLDSKDREAFLEARDSLEAPVRLSTVILSIYMYTSLSCTISCLGSAVVER